MNGGNLSNVMRQSITNSSISVALEQSKFLRWKVKFCYNMLATDSSNLSQILKNIFNGNLIEHEPYRSLFAHNSKIKTDNSFIHYLEIKIYVYQYNCVL